MRKHRSELAKQQQVAAYVVFADKTLIDMVRLKPRNTDEMGMVHGVGEAKLRQYGESFLETIRQHAAEPLTAPSRRNPPEIAHFRGVPVVAPHGTLC